MMTATQQPRIYVSSEDTVEGLRFWAEVVIDAGDETEKVLYSTGFFDNEAGARLDAKAWIKKQQAK